MSAVGAEVTSPFFVIQQEARNVLVALRRNSRWSSLGRLSKSVMDTTDLSLLKGMQIITKDLVPSTNFDEVDPLFFIQPFLDIITSESTSGPITGVSLSSLDHFIRANIIKKQTTDASRAIHGIIEAVTHCRFEATDPEGDEVVLARILQVLTSCVTSSVGELLGDDSVCEIVQSCFRISQQRRMSELLRHSAEESLFEIIRYLFSSLKRMSYDKLPLTQSRDVVPLTTFSAEISSTVEIVEESETARVADPTPSSNGEPETPQHAEHNRVIMHLSPIAAEASDPSKLSQLEVLVPATPPNIPAQKSLGISLENGYDSLTQVSSSPVPFSLPAIAEIFRFICSLISKTQVDFHIELQLLGLQLLHEALSAGADFIKNFPPLLQIIQDSLCRNLIRNCHSDNLLILTYSLESFYILYLQLRDHLKLQMEFFFNDIFLDTLKSKDMPLDKQETILESLLQFCQLPYFTLELFLNYDACLNSSNMFEELTKALSKHCNPGKGTLHNGHVLSLDCIVAAMDVLDNRCGDETHRGRREEKRNVPPELDAIYKMRKKKKDLSIAVEMFNKKPKQGIAALKETGFLSEPIIPQLLADFLRKTPSLTKDIIGEYIGEPGDLPVQVLKKYAQTFDFVGMTFDEALRMFLESFRLPGEAQKIDRIMESFSGHYHAQCPGQFANSDAAFTLAFAVVMLNTDHHSVMIKKKMTQEQFIRNVSGINNGSDLPRDQLVAIFESITKNEIKLPGKSSTGDNGSLWAELLGRSKFEPKYIVGIDPHGRCPVVYDKELFTILSQPAIDALSIIYYSAEDTNLNKEMTDGIKSIVHVASKFHLSKVVDNVIIPLCKFTTLQDQYDTQEHVRIIGRSQRARNSCNLLFSLANQYGDHFQEGWRAIVDCIIKLQRLDLLPDNILKVEDFVDPGSKRPYSPSVVVQEVKSSSFLSTFSQYLSLNMDAGDANQPNQEARDVAKQSVVLCRLEDLINDSKLLQPESLVYFVRAIILASMKPKQIPSTPADESSVVFCTELLTTISIKNEDRIIFLWILVNEHFSSLLVPETTSAFVIERSIVCLFRLCLALISNSDILDQLYQCLALIKNVDSNLIVNSSIPEQISNAMQELIRAHPESMKISSFSRVVSSLLRKTTSHPSSAVKSFESFVPFIQEPNFLTAENFSENIETLLVLSSNKEMNSAVAKRSLDIILSITSQIPKLMESYKLFQQKKENASYFTMTANTNPTQNVDVGLEECKFFWYPVLNFYSHHARDPRHDVRTYSLAHMQRVLLSSDAQTFTNTFARLVFVESLFPLIGDLLNSDPSSPKRSTASPQLGRSLGPQYEELLIRILEILSKTFLHFLARLSTLDNFDSFWFQILAFMEVFYKKGKSEVLEEAVSERVKNMIFVMSAQEIFHEKNDEIWQNTWRALEAFCPSLKEELLAALTPPQATETAALPASGGQELLPTSLETHPTHLSEAAPHGE